MPMSKFRMADVVDARKIQISSGALKMRISHSIIKFKPSHLHYYRATSFNIYMVCLYVSPRRATASAQRETERSKERDPAESRSDHYDATNYFNVIERLQPPLTAPLQPSVSNAKEHMHRSTYHPNALTINELASFNTL